jgi:ABC-type multidrug transport system ATPase subunit
MSAIIEARGLTKSFGDTHALAGLDLTAEAGRVTALLGPNGAGKTTFISAVSTLLLRPTRASSGSPGSTCWPTRRRCVRSSGSPGSTPRSSRR